MDRYLSLAKRISERSDSRFRVGCVIVRKNRVISVGWNDMRKSHPKCGTYGNYLHAEIRSLLKLSGADTQNATAYVCRILANGNVGLAKPCPVCYRALKLAGIVNVVYTTNDGEERLSIR